MGTSSHVPSHRRILARIVWFCVGLVVFFADNVALIVLLYTTHNYLVNAKDLLGYLRVSFLLVAVLFSDHEAHRAHGRRN